MFADLETCNFSFNYHDSLRQLGCLLLLSYDYDLHTSSGDAESMALNLGSS